MKIIWPSLFSKSFEDGHSHFWELLMRLHLSCSKEGGWARRCGQTSTGLSLPKDELKCGSGVMGWGQMKILTWASLDHENLWPATWLKTKLYHSSHLFSNTHLHSEFPPVSFCLGSLSYLKFACPRYLPQSPKCKARFHTQLQHPLCARGILQDGLCSKRLEVSVTPKPI